MEDKKKSPLDEIDENLGDDDADNLYWQSTPLLYAKVATNQPSESCAADFYQDE